MVAADGLGVGEAPFVVLSDGVITMRCLELGDAHAHLAGEDPDQVRWLNDGHRSVPERLGGWILSNQQEWLDGSPRRHFGIRDTMSGALIGNAEAHLALPELALGEVNISYAVFPAWRGRGVAARAVRLLCVWLGDTSDAHLAVIRVAGSNVHSNGVAIAADFSRSGLITSGDGEQMVRYERRLKPDI